MSAVIRETFIALHSSDVLGRLSNEVTCSHHPETSYHHHHLRLTLFYILLVPRAIRGFQSPSWLLEVLADAQTVR
jgi:hypothetical protein